MRFRKTISRKLDFLITIIPNISLAILKYHAYFSIDVSTSVDLAGGRRWPLRILRPRPSDLRVRGRGVYCMDIFTLPPLQDFPLFSFPFLSPGQFNFPFHPFSNFFGGCWSYFAPIIKISYFSKWKIYTPDLRSTASAPWRVARTALRYPHSSNGRSI